MKDWVCIYTSQNLQDAEMVNGVLSFNEIQSVLINKQDSAYMFGEFEVYVNRNQAVEAKFILKKSNLSENPSTG